MTISRRPIVATLLTALLLPFAGPALLAGDKSGEPSKGCNNGSEQDDPCTPTTSCAPCGDCTTTPCDDDDGYDDGYSVISLRSQIHLHTAFDYRITNDGGGCTPCGGASAPSGPLHHLEIQRIHRQRSIGSGGSLGAGTYLSFDKQIEITRDTGNSAGVAATVRYFDPANTSIKMTLNERSNGDTVIDGVLHDTGGLFTELRFLKADGTTTPDWLQAATASLVTTMGQRFVFEIVRTSSDAASTARFGRLIKEVDRNGNAVTLTYVHPATATDAALGNDRAKLWQYATVSDHFAQSATITWDATKRGARYAIASIALPNSTTVGYRYSGSNLIGVDHADGSSSSFSTTYDTTLQKTVYTWDDNAAGGTHMRKKTYVTGTSWVDPVSGTSIGQTSGQIVRVDNANGERRFVLWTESADINRRFIWRAGRGLIAYKTDSGGRNVVKVDWAVSYDLDQPASTYVFETKKSFANDSTRALITQTTDALGRVTKNTYESKTRLVTKRTEADNTFTTITYNDFGQPLTQTDRLGRVTTFTYDAKGNLLSRTEGTGTEQSVWRWTYNARGQVLAATDANGNVTDHVYDASGRLVNVLEPADLAGGARPTRTFAYDTPGRLTRTTDQDGRYVDYTHDVRNRVTKLAYGGNVGITTDYETATYGTTPLTANLVTQRRDRNGYLTTFTYDNSGRTTAVTRASGTPVAISETTTYVPGTIDQVASTTRGGETTTLAYDHRGRLLTTTVMPRTSKTLVTTIGYDAIDREVSLTDAYGRRTLVVYDVNGRVVRQIRELIPGGVPTGLTLATLARSTVVNPPYVIIDTTYDAEGQTLSRTDGRGIGTTFAYDSQGRLKTEVRAATAPAGITALAYTTTTAYDAQGNRTAVTHPRTGQAGETGTFQTTYAYTGRNLLKSTTEAAGRAEAATTSATFTNTGKPKTVIDFRGKVTTTTYYPCCDRVKDTVEPGGATTTLTYDYHGNVTSVKDANGHTTTMTYDARHRTATVTNAESETTTYAYDDNGADATGLSSTYAAKLTGLALGAGSDGSLVEVTNPVGEKSVQVQDGLDRVVRTIDGNGNTVTTAYDTVVASLVETTVTDALSHATSVRADGAGLARSSIDALGKVSSGGFDANGNRVSLRDPNAVGQDCVFDAVNRDIRCTDTAGAVTSRTYDAHGNVRTSTDALGLITTSVFDGRERKTSSTDRVAGVTAFTYDANRNLLSITDAEGRVTTYAYDDRNQLVSETYPAGKATPTAGTDKRTYTYDAGRRLKTRTDQAGVVTTYVYDKANRMTERQYPDGLNDGFAYDDASRLTQATSARFNTNVARSYTLGGEKGGRLRSETQTVGGFAFTVGYGYDADNRPTTITHPNGKQVVRSYTARHQLAGTTYDGSSIATRAYDNGGRLITTTLGNTKVETRTYKPDNTVATIQVPGVTNFSYTYDANKRKTYEGHQFASDIQEFTSYDGENRLTSWKRDGVETQNWTISKVGDWSATTRNGTAQTRTHSPVHEVLTTVTGGVTSTLDYDQKGNLTLDQQGQRYDWDVENRLQTARAGASTSGYAYDALGRRLGKTALGIFTTFVHDGAQVIAEYEAPLFASLPIGAPAITGSYTANPTGTMTVVAAGQDFWHTPDQGHYAYGILTGNGSITVKVDGQTNTNEWAKAGVMLREGTAADAVYGGIFISPTSGVTFQQRSITGAPTTSTIVTGVAAPVWLRLTRTGTSISAAYSTTGSTWTAVGSAWTGPAAAALTVGLAATSHRAELAGTVVYSSVQVSGNVKTVASPAFVRGYVYGTYVDEPLAILPASGAAADRKFVHANHLYSVAALTDNAGNVVERYRYDAYGQRTVLAADGATTRAASSYGNQVGFTGRYLDRETSLSYFRARYYSGSLGRFLARDPWRSDGNTPTAGDGYVEGGNLYEGYFAPNGLDPDGKKSCTEHSLNYKFDGPKPQEATLFYGPYGIKVRGGYQVGNLQLKGKYKKCCCSETNYKYEGSGRLEAEASAWIFAGWYYYGQSAWGSIAVKAGARGIATASVQGNFGGYYDFCTNKGALTADFTFQGTAGIEGYGYAALETFWGWEWNGEARIGGRGVIKGSGKIECDESQCKLYAQVTVGGELYAQFRISTRISYTYTTGIYYEFPGTPTTFASPVRWIFG